MIARLSKGGVCSFGKCVTRLTFAHKAVLTLQVRGGALQCCAVEGGMLLRCRLPNASLHNFAQLT
eukprot:1152698-Pelagomonas_calceolata.AAC.6